MSFWSDGVFAATTAVTACSSSSVTRRLYSLTRAKKWLGQASKITFWMTVSS